MVPTAAALLVLSEPITQVIYQRGEFDAAQSELVSEALFYFALSLPFAGVNLLLIRAFFSLQRPWVPTLIALGNLVLTAGLERDPLRADGDRRHRARDGDRVARDGASRSAAVLRPRLGGLDGRRTLDAGIRILVASALLGGRRACGEGGTRRASSPTTSPASCSSSWPPALRERQPTSARCSRFASRRRTRSGRWSARQLGRLR